MITAEELISLLGLKPHPSEGGYFIETYRSDEAIPEGGLPIRYKSKRPFSTTIYYLLTPDSCSVMHRLQTDEIFHFYLGDPVEMLHLLPDGSGKSLLIGADISRGMRPQVVVPRGIWQGARLLSGGRLALLGTTVSPGFDFSDYETGDRDQLIQSYPRFRDRILSLTRSSDAVDKGRSS